MNRYVYAPFALGFMYVGAEHQAVSSYQIKNCELENYLADKHNLPDRAKIYFSLSSRLSGSAFTTLLALCKIHDENRQRGFQDCSSISMAPAAHLKSLLNRSNSGKSSKYIESAILELTQINVKFTAQIDGTEIDLSSAPILTEFCNGKLTISEATAFSTLDSVKSNRNRNWSFGFSDAFEILLKRDLSNKPVFTTAKYNLDELTQYRSDSIALQIMAHISVSARENRAAFPRSILKLMERLGFEIKDLINDKRKLKKAGDRVKKAIKKIPTLITRAKDKTYKHFIYQTLIHDYNLAISTLINRVKQLRNPLQKLRYIPPSAAYIYIPS